ncbi:enoyl-CoA hydratase-related protein [Xanthobacter autotrophicus]|uniref:enoyl-CoA hydratase-related protein n=1 Tax=Xanthobacter autotrophicus TaxID=280 RepID=UPI00372D4742
MPCCPDHRNWPRLCAGQDLAARALADQTPDLSASLEAHYNPLVRDIRALRKPVICAVNGRVAGAGASIAPACHIVLAARSAKFIPSSVRISLIPDSGGTLFPPSSHRRRTGAGAHAPRRAAPR